MPRLLITLLLIVNVILSAAQTTAKKKTVTKDSLFDKMQQLDELVVTGQRSVMKLEVDKKTYTVDQILSSAGGTASDILQSIPSVDVDNDGTVSLRGNTSVEVWINGKASGLTSDNRGEILEQMPAESIEKIEVITNPSAKFSPEGSAGIINIVLKRNRKAGYYGSLQGGVNNQGGYNTSGNINYNNGKIDAYANLGFRHRSKDGSSLSRQDNITTGRYQNYDSDSNRKRTNWFGRAGITLHASKSDDISLSGMSMLGSRDNSETQLYHNGTINASQDIYQMNRMTDEDASMRMIYTELGYKHNFSDKHNLDFTLSYSNWRMNNDNYYQDSITYLDNITPREYLYQYRPTKIRNRSWEMKIDYENAINDRLKIQAGYDGKLNHENSPQESYVDSADWNGSSLKEDSKYYNRFIYDHSIHALYATATAHIGKLGAQLGLRGEYWRVKTDSYDYEQEHDATKRDATFKKNYFKMFPSIFLTYTLPASQEIQLNYTRRLSRPWGGQLNSFKNTRDASITSYGNPELTPEYTDAFEMNYIKNWSQHTLSLSAYYRPTTDVIQQVKYQSKTDGMMYATNENVAKSTSTGMEIVLKNKLFRILDLTSTANAYFYSLDGFSYDIDGQTVTGDDSHSFSWTAKIMANLLLPWNISFQTEGNFKSRQTITQGYQRSNYFINMGLRKSFLNKKLSVAINAKDIFNTRKDVFVTNGEGFSRMQKTWGGSRRLSFVIAYNFGSNNMKKPRQRLESNDSEDEQTMGGGDGE